VFRLDDLLLPQPGWAFVSLVRTVSHHGSLRLPLSCMLAPREALVVPTTNTFQWKCIVLL
jgi:hypothetical protein